MSKPDQPKTFPYKVAVLCDLRDADGRVLLLHRAKDPNKGLYSPIGGKLDTAMGESPAQCARREIMEESGLDIPMDKLHLVGIISERGYEGETNWLLFWFRVTMPVELEPFEMREGRLDWHSLDELKDLSLPLTDREVIWPLVLRHGLGFFSVHIDCSNGTQKWHVEQSEPRVGPI